MPRIVFEGKVTENGELNWDIDNDWGSNRNAVALKFDDLCFIIHLDGRLNGPSALTKVKQLLEASDYQWLEVKNTKGCVNIERFREWLFHSVYVDVLRQIRWFSAENVQIVEKDWDFLSTQHRINHQWKTSVGLCIASGELAPQTASVSTNTSDPALVPPVPPAIQSSLAKLQKDHVNDKAIAFVMMKFGTTKDHNEIINAIKTALKPHKIAALRADDRLYHDSLYENILTYLHGCSFGIAIFERIENDEHNPNVALEVGYLLAMDKPVCILKDKSVKQIQADLIGKLYQEFDSQNAKMTIPPVLTKWLSHKGIIIPVTS
jgi:hypothetical protein